MSEPLTQVDVRVLGSLIEKEKTTPEYYPLSLNSLVNACNQLSNREPVMQLDEPDVNRSISALRERGLIRATKGIDARVTKYAHRVNDVMDLGSKEVALMGVLMLRGPQTTGELRTRTARMTTFEDLDEVENVLEALIGRAIVARLPRQPGQKEVRYAHLLTGETPVAAARSVTPEGTGAATTSTVNASQAGDRIGMLEETVKEMQKELADLRTQLERFRAQFE